MLAAPSPPDVVAAAGDADAAADVGVENRPSAGLPLIAVKGSVVPGAPADDTSATPAIVDPACSSPVSVPPTAAADELRLTVPAPPIAAASVDQATLQLTDVLPSASEPSPPPQPSLAPSVPVDPTPPDDVPPAPPT
jgi:hypothetical protein